MLKHRKDKWLIYELAQAMEDEENRQVNGFSLGFDELAEVCLDYIKDKYYLVEKK